MPEWRLGSQVALNVYDGDRPVCQCHNEHDAKLMVFAVNLVKRKHAEMKAKAVEPSENESAAQPQP